MNARRSNATAPPSLIRDSAQPIARSELLELLRYWRTRHGNWSRVRGVSPRETAGAHGHASATLAAIEDLEDVMAGKRPRERPING